MTYLLALVLAVRAWGGAAPSDPTVVHHTARVAFSVWSGFLTHGDGPRCELRPSCSAFARQALARDGLSGLMLVTDRFLREPGAMTLPPHPDGGYRDPLTDHPPPLSLLSGAYCRRQRRQGAQVCL